MNYGKSIRLFLVEGTADGRWMCELSNWTGKAYKIPRKYVKTAMTVLNLQIQVFTFYSENLMIEIHIVFT